MVILFCRPISTYSVVIAPATIAIHRFLLSCPVEVLPGRRRGQGRDPSEADVPPFAGPVLLGDGAIQVAFHWLKTSGANVPGALSAVCS